MKPVPTPRTDAAMWLHRLADTQGEPPASIYVVNADLCAELETENAALLEALKEMRQSIGQTPHGDPSYLMRGTFARWTSILDAAIAKAKAP